MPVTWQPLTTCFQFVKDEVNVLIRATVEHILNRGRLGHYKQRAIVHYETILLKRGILVDPKIGENRVHLK